MSRVRPDFNFYLIPALGIRNSVKEVGSIWKFSGGKGVPYDIVHLPQLFHGSQGTIGPVGPCPNECKVELLDPSRFEGERPQGSHPPAVGGIIAGGLLRPVFGTVGQLAPGSPVESVGFTREHEIAFRTIAPRGQMPVPSVNHPGAVF